jgi:energy-coupling factor transport system ATP-binding protein
VDGTLVVIASLEKVSYFYPRTERPALADLNLQLQAGEFFGLIGPTGAGKTTLCLALNAIVPQFYGGRFFGRIAVAGLDTIDHPTSRLARHVGMVFEDPETQLISASVENEVAFALENMKVSPEEIRARIPTVLEMVRLDGLEKKHPADLSGGQKQRLAIAAVLAARPDLLVLDEPTSQLDPVGTQEVFATIAELNRSLGMTIFITSHASEELAETATRVGLLVNGKLERVGTPGEIFSEVDLLEASQLRPPQVSATFHLIRRRGIRLPAVPVRLEEGRAALVGLAPQAQLTISEKREESAVPADQPPLIRVRDLAHTYPDGTQALHGISMDIRRGEYLLIAGQNGAGKSTLVRHFLNLLRPTAGQVEVGGVDTRRLPVSDLARKIGYVAQNPDQQIFNTTVAEEIGFALKNLGSSPAQIRQRTEESLAAMGLEAVRGQHPLALPRGDRARVVIAAVLALHPEVLIFDEPTTGQDFRGAQYILDITRRLHAQGKTVIVITHHLYLMPGYVSRAVVLGKGTLLVDGGIRQVFHAVDMLRASYLVPPQAVLLVRELGRLRQHDLDLLTPAELAACFPTPAERP